MYISLKWDLRTNNNLLVQFCMTKMSKAGHIKHPIILGLLTCLSSPSKHPYDAPKMFFKWRMQKSHYTILELILSCRALKLYYSIISPLFIILTLLEPKWKYSFKSHWFPIYLHSPQLKGCTISWPRCHARSVCEFITKFCPSGCQCRCKWRHLLQSPRRILTRVEW